jgi:hypothetical protein
MESKLKNLQLTVAQCKKMPDIAVLMGIHFDACPAALMKLDEKFSFDNLQKNNCFYTGSEEAALAYAYYEAVRNKFVGSPLEVAKSRVSRIDYNAQNSKFMISWNTQGSMSMLRKTIGLALSVINPHKLYSKYAVNIKNLGGKADRDVFNFVANKMVEAIKKGVKIAAVGRIKVDGEKLKDLLTKVDKKQPKLITEKGTKPDIHENFTHSFPSIKASGISAAVTADYVRSQGMGVSVLGSEIIVYNKSFESKKKIFKNATRVKNYVGQKYEKLKTDFPCIFAYLCITQSLCDCCTATSIIKTKPTASSMVSIIQKTL